MHRVFVPSWLAFCVLAMAFTVSASPASAQSQIVNAQVETHQATRDLAAEIQTVATAHDPAWVAYKISTVRGPQRTCDSNGSAQVKVMLEPASELIVLIRVAGQRAERIRTVTPECEVDAGGLPVVWLEGISASQSAEWLTTQIASAGTNEPREPRFVLSALAALIWHPGDGPLRTMITLARTDRRPLVRGQALFWLARRASQQSIDTIRGAVDNDPETEVKRKAVFALSQLPKDQGIPLLIDVARNNRNREVRRQAMFWLGQSNDPRAVSFFEEVLK